MGANAISQKQLKELQDSVMKLRAENDLLKREWTEKETQLKMLTQKVRDEKSQIEKQLYTTEFTKQEVTAEMERFKDQSMKDRLVLED